MRRRRRKEAPTAQLDAVLGELKCQITSFLPLSEDTLNNFLFNVTPPA